MKHKKIITILVLLIAIVSILATSFGIFSKRGTGSFEYETIRGQKITIYGKGLYAHMSADVAIQGIAQDYITLFVGVPFLIIALLLARKNSLRGMLLLSGTIFYFLLTYLFYTAMAMYNMMFLAYVFLLGASLFALILTLFSYDINNIKESIKSERILKNAGIFLIINASLIALLWLSGIIPPLLDGTIIPTSVQHYTTLIVQGFDLGIFLPIAFVSGLLAVKKNAYGYLFTPIYIIFLCFLMTALVSKIIYMASTGANVIPVIFIMPTIDIISIIFAVMLLRNVKKV